MNIEKIVETLDVFAKERDWEQFHSSKNLTMALSVETAELVEIFQWLTEKQSDDLTDKQRLCVEEELADIAIYLLKICSKQNINLEDAIFKKIEKNKDKYPISKSKGIAKKYNEL